MRFLGHNFCSRHAKRSIKSSIYADHHLVSKKNLIQNFWPQKHPNFAASTQKNPNSNQKIFSIDTRRRAASVQGLNSSLAIVSGELWRCKRV